MDYELVTLNEKTVVGLCARTSNRSPDMGAVIGGLWQTYYQGGIYPQISGKKNGKALGIYSDYTGPDKSEYKVTVGCEADGFSLPQGTERMAIPAGRYAKFVVRGHVQKAVGEFWERLWTMDLPRSFVCDFEEYQDGNFENAEIHIYISLTE